MEILLLFEDALIELQKIKSESIDLVCTDPPYGISVNNKITRKETKDINFDFGEWDHFKTEEDFVNFTRKWFIECVRVLKEDGWMYIFFSNRHMWVLHELIRKYKLVIRTNFTWIKTNPAPSYRKYNWRSATEPVLVLTKKNIRIPNFLTQHEMNNYKETSCRCNYGVSGHPTEKPIELIELFVKTSSNEGDTVLDPFMGSGTTGMACLLNNRKFIGIENSLKWFSVAELRLKNYQMYKKAIQGDSLLL